MRDVKRDELRGLLKRIAMGLAVSPLALIAACAGYSFAPCPESFVERRGVTQAQLDAWMTSSGCAAPCGESSGRAMSIGCLIVERADASMVSVDAESSGADGGPSAETVAWVECTYQQFCEGGRRPASGVTSVRGQGVAAWLTETAQLEAASIDAFAELRDELRAHQAPRSLIQETHRAEADEVRHARWVGQLALCVGARPMRPSVVRSEPRSLVAIAQHNASEGCVREAYGALVALHQAHNASSPEVREGFLRIARDEARHALLSLELDDWMRTQLSANQVRQLDETRALAMLEVAENVGREDVATRTVLGLPDEERGQDLVRLVA